MSVYTYVVACVCIYVLCPCACSCARARGNVCQPHDLPLKDAAQEEVDRYMRMPVSTSSSSLSALTRLNVHARSMAGIS